MKNEYTKGDMVKRTKSAELGKLLEKNGWKKTPQVIKTKPKGEKE